MPDRRVMPESSDRTRQDPPPAFLRVGVSTRALFDREAEHAVFVEAGPEAYVARQQELAGERMAKGPGFRAIERLLKLNPPTKPAPIEVILLSRNAPDASLRIFASVREHGLSISKGSFTNGGPVAPLVEAWGLDLFLSNHTADVRAALASGIAAAKFGAGSVITEGPVQDGEFRIAFDGDAVVFSDESDKIYELEGSQAFVRHETDNTHVCLPQGPFASLLNKLAVLRGSLATAAGTRCIRIALVTARSAPAHARAMNTLRAWGCDVDEAHFVGERDKGPFIKAFGADIFFDDRKRHVASASRFAAAAHVVNENAFFRDARPPLSVDTRDLGSADACRRAAKV